MGLTSFTNARVLNALYNAASLGAPATHFIGLGAAPQWTASHAYSSGAYVIPTNFNSTTGQSGRLFKCTTAGTSSATQPTWPTTPGATVTDGGVTWTEVTLLLQQGTITGLEISGNNYARVSVTSNTTNFGTITAAQPEVMENTAAINFPSPSADWGLVPIFFDFDASSAGNLWAWGLMSSALDCAASSSPSFGIDALQESLTP